MPYSRKDLDLAVRHIREGEIRVRDLEEDIRRFEARGYDATVPIFTLQLFKDVLVSMREHESNIRADVLRRERVGQA
jgi:hypothetical protein